MTDDEEVLHLDQDDANSVIQWATGTAALLVTLELDLEEIKDAFPDDPWDAVEAFVGALEMMREAMPEILAEPAVAIAAYAIEEVEREEAEVESFREEIEKFTQGE